jgi:hypothetical protein
MPSASAGLLLGLLINPEHGSNIKLQNMNYKPLQPHNTVLFKVTIMRKSEPTADSEIDPWMRSGVTDTSCKHMVCTTEGHWFNITHRGKVSHHSI